ncbi:amino acid ABC transporter permease [Halotalea alkalilenta]|uniref:Amino acid ABC transporter permease n=1 Tax=Halotalea alkalilenta TaxID=376489 RepID=A0A172YBQ2_9GAMM|nr:amino acid ABC transporter permease [Halotalea alkalilenta]ANF56681.1 amino acid ABC transporter permease [Halotalea alkalilenta]
MLRPSTSIPKRARGPLWRDPQVRSLVIQTVLLIALVGIIMLMIHNTMANLQARGINTGFAFLDYRAGFSIAQTLNDYSSNSSYGDAFLAGLYNTLLVSILGIIASTVVGLVVGIARLSPNWLLARVATVYIEIFRNIPLLLQILFWYFAALGALPQLRQSLSLFDLFFLNQRGMIIPAPIPGEGFSATVYGLLAAVVLAWGLARMNKKRQAETGQRLPIGWINLGVIVVIPLVIFLISGSPLSWSVPELVGFNYRGGLHMIPELIGLWVALTIYTASFIAEIVRSGIQSVSHGQTEAASSLGLPKGITMRKVIMPQAMRLMIPQLSSQYLSLTKNSSLAIAIGYPDLFAVFGNTTMNQTGQAVEIMAITMGVYLALSLITSLLMNLFNSRMALKER